MNRRGDEFGQIGFDELCALERDAELRADHCLRGGRSETDDGARFYDVDLGLQPRAAGADLRGVRLLVDATFPARLPFEMLDDVSDVDGRPIDAGLGERFVEESPGGADE